RAELWQVVKSVCGWKYVVIGKISGNGRCLGTCGAQKRGSELVSSSVLGKPLLVVFSQTLNVPARKAHVVRIARTFGSHVAAYKKVAVPNLESYLVHPEIFKRVSVGALINSRTKPHFFLKHDFEVIGK